VFTKSGFGVTVGIVLLGICRNGAAELAINVEGGSFPRIVEETNVSFRRVLRCCKLTSGTEEEAKTTFNALPWRGNTSRQALFPLRVIPGES
jgi:hypothetical protein